MLNIKTKTSNLIEVMSTCNICSGIKSQQEKKIFLIQYQKLDFSQNSSVSFHQVTFYHSILYVLLIDKRMKAAKIP